MINGKFDQWCRSATLLIRFGPDREKVAQELFDHLEDHYNTLIEKGFSHEDATAQVLACMGDDKEISRQLAAVHRPFWGYFLRVTRVAVAVLLCLCLLTVWDYFSNLKFGIKSYRDFEIFEAASYGGDTGRTLLHLSEPGCAFSIDGSTFTVTDAAVFTESANGTEKTRFYFRIEQFSWVPWSVQKYYFGLHPTHNTISAQFYAVDSLGTVYDSYYTRNEDEPYYVVPSGGQTGVFTYTHECWINEFDPDAQWIEICYTRDGRDLRMKIMLKGGVLE